MSRAAALLEADVRSIPALIEAKRTAADRQGFRDRVGALSTWATMDLLPRLQTATDPLMLWALHVELDKRDIPPCIRFPGHQLGPQGDYITLAADVLWLHKRHPEHKALYRGWASVLAAPRGREKWHQNLYRQFLFAYPRGLAYLVSKGLALATEHRQQLASVPTPSMVKIRAALEGEAFTSKLDQLTQHATEHPDRSGKYKPADIGRRRAQLYRVHALSGKSPTRTAELWHRLSGEKLSRQTVSRQIEAAGLVIG